MKKFWFLPLTLLCLFSLTACQSDSDTAATPPEYEPALLPALVQQGVFSEELEELDGDTAFALYQLEGYGLSREDLTDCAVLRSSGATCEEAAVLRFPDQARCEAAETALQSYIQAQIDANTDYRPNEIPKLEEALISRRGSSLLLVVAHSMDAVQSVIG